MWEKIILFTFINNRTPIINVYFALTGVGQKIPDHHTYSIGSKYVKGMGANKTRKAILWAFHSGAGVHETMWSFDKATNIHKVSQTHSARSSVEDELMMLCSVEDLRKFRPFRVVSGRCHAHFPNIAISTTANLDVGELLTWLERHKNQIERSL